MNTNVTGMIFDIQGFSVQDGPGIRTTVFLKGCPLRCPWCHSPESQKFYPQLSWLAQKCVGLEHCHSRCVDACPRKAVSPGELVDSVSAGTKIQHVRVDRTLCDNCGRCAEACYPGALSICGKKYTVDEVIEIVTRDVPFYETSGGGVTISGGECMSQPEFTLELLKALKSQNIHTAVDTTGFVPWEQLEKVLPYTDLFLYDLKHADSETHKAVTGVPNDIIIENAMRISQSGGKIQIRIPVIPGFNSGRRCIMDIGEVCVKLGDAVTLVQLLPYHNLGAMKYLRLSSDANVFDVEPPSEELVQGHKAALEGLGLTVTIH